MSAIATFLEHQGYNKIPFRIRKSNHLYLNARINGVKGLFLLDTGASTTCIDLNQQSVFLLDSSQSNVKASGAGSNDLYTEVSKGNRIQLGKWKSNNNTFVLLDLTHVNIALRSEEHTSELQSRPHLVCRLLLEKKNERRGDGRRELRRPCVVQGDRAGGVLVPRPAGARQGQRPHGRAVRGRRAERQRRARRDTGERHRPRKAQAGFFFFNDPATTEIYTLSLHDALPI